MKAQQIQEILATNIKRVRKELGYTQAELAELANISTGYMCDIENCRKWPGPENFCTLARVLKLIPYQLILPAEDSPYFDRHRVITSYTKQLKEAIAKSMDFAYEKIMDPYSTDDTEIP